jgi:uncharacterized protein with FMN-binding domain
MYKSFGEFVMSGKTKIVVLKMKELICAGIFLALGILAIILLVVTSKENTPFSDTPADSSAIYVPGTYTTAMTLNGSQVELAVTVDETAILSIELQNLDETISVMYPLMEPALEELASQIMENQSIDNIEYSSDNLYTSTVLLNAITAALNQAAIANTDSPDVP